MERVKKSKETKEEEKSTAKQKLSSVSHLKFENMVQTFTVNPLVMPLLPEKNLYVYRIILFLCYIISKTVDNF